MIAPYVADLASILLAGILLESIDRSEKRVSIDSELSSQDFFGARDKNFVSEYAAFELRGFLHPPFWGPF